MTSLFIIINILSSFNGVDWLIYLGLLAVLGSQLWSIFKIKTITKKRLWIKLALNIFVWVVLLLFIIQPQWTYSANTNKVLLVSADVPTVLVQHTKDSLHISESFSVKDFNQRIVENPDLINPWGSIYLFGQEFSPELLSHLSQKDIVWIPFFKKDDLQDIHWKGIVRKGDIQEITGKIETSEAAMLRIKYASHVLDSVMLQKGFNQFTLRFPAFAIGRTETVLELGEKPLQNIAFFGRKNPTSSIQFILGNPDFESKTLAEWLGRNGNRVEITTTIAKNAQNKVSLNRTDKKKEFIPDIVITDPGNASSRLVKSSLITGKSVLFINLTNPEQEIRSINQAIGTNWHTKKISNEEHISIESNLTALPYHFEDKLNQKTVSPYPVAIHKIGGKVGVSLLNETYPIKLSGDSLTYNRIWASIFQQLNPSPVDNIEVEAPLFQDTQASTRANNLSISSNDLKIANDTSQLIKSSINPLSSTTNFIFRKAGWQPLQDSLEVYVDENPTTLWKSKQIQEILAAHANSATQIQASSSQKLSAKLPDWVWLVLILVSLSALWIEPKLSY